MSELERNPLWLILVEAVHRLPLYPSHKAYVKYTLLLESPQTSPEELSMRMDIPLGEALVILHEIQREQDKSIDDEQLSEPLSDSI